jgi:hypothetical protein
VKVSWGATEQAKRDALAAEWTNIEPGLRKLDAIADGRLGAPA